LLPSAHLRSGLPRGGHGAGYGERHWERARRAGRRASRRSGSGACRRLGHGSRAHWPGGRVGPVSGPLRKPGTCASQVLMSRTQRHPRPAREVVVKGGRRCGRDSPCGPGAGGCRPGHRPPANRVGRDPARRGLSSRDWRPSLGNWRHWLVARHRQPGSMAGQAGPSNTGGAGRGLPSLRQGRGAGGAPLGRGAGLTASRVAHRRPGQTYR
jgi:hypothetical protein